MQEHQSEQAEHQGEAKDGGLFADLASLMALVTASVRDTTRLLGLETRWVALTLFRMLVLCLVLGLVAAGIWMSITLAVVASLYEYSPLGMTLSICVATLVNLALAAALFYRLKRMAQRLSFPQTRMAVHGLIAQATQIINNKE